MTFPVVLPAVGTLPGAPTPTADHPVAPNATEMRTALYDARRETFRARYAALGSCWLAGLQPQLVDGTLQIGPGIVQLAIPYSGWSATPSGTKLLAPSPPAGSGIDGAYRAEVHSTITMRRDDTGFPRFQEYVVWAEYDETQPERVKFDFRVITDLDTSPLDLLRQVPLAYVSCGNTTVDYVRDLRAPYMPRTPRIVQVVFGTLTDWTPIGTGDRIIPGTDMGSFYLDANHGVLFTIALRLNGNAGALGNQGFRAWVRLSRGRVNDGFVGWNRWYHSDYDTFPAYVGWQVPRVGDSNYYWRHLFVPKPWSGEIAGYPVVVPGVFHFNGFTLDPAATATHDGGNTGVRWAFASAQYCTLRATDVAAESYPAVPIYTGRE